MVLELCAMQHVPEQHKQAHTLSGARFKNSHFRMIVSTRLTPRAPDINVGGVSVCFEIQQRWLFFSHSQNAHAMGQH